MAEERAAGLNVGVGVEASSPWLPTRQQSRFRCGGVDSLNRLRSASQHHDQKLQQHSLVPSSKHAHSRPTRKWVTGGSEMQAVFLDSAVNKRSCGTGVFLPQVKPDMQLHPIKKPVCSPVLLPSHVVQALNLNVHDLALKITSREELNEFSSRKKTVADQLRKEPIQKPSHVFSEKECSSPEIFLPKEWTY